MASSMIIIYQYSQIYFQWDIYKLINIYYMCNQAANAFSHVRLNRSSYNSVLSIIAKIRKFALWW